MTDAAKDDEEVTGGIEGVDMFPVALLVALLKPAGGIFHPIMASNAVGVLVGRVAPVPVEEGAVMLSVCSGTNTCLRLTEVMSLTTLVTGGLVFSRRFGAPSRKAWDVFSLALTFPTSTHEEPPALLAFFVRLRKRPFTPRTLTTMH